ncbi:thyroid hormone receptor alpha [Plakobranchus ocellatus]|uniref:Thyroid hormone receptor alpha n=1 Tax=Plakobranchus ocellatus TaxID=259542 RepID=A0AAV4BV09_9GAST|nr:thyroid hormone receptor alpha [Plakobranchus ocellatus]
MAELIKLLQTNESFKSELMETLLSQSCGNVSKTSTNGQTSSTSPISPNANLDVANDNETSPSSGATTTTTSAAQTKLGNINDNSSTASQRVSDLPFYVDPNANCLSDVQNVLSQAKGTPSQNRRLLIGQITDVTTAAHMATTLNTQENIQEANERITRQQEAAGAEMPDMSSLSLNPGVMMKHFLNSMVPEMTKVVNFSKNLPGFSELDMDDQVKLVKQGIFEVMIARITLLIDHVTDTMIDPSLKMKSPRAMVRQMSPLGILIDQFFDIAKQIGPLNLTDGEHGLFGALLVFCPDRHGLSNVTAVQTIQQLYLQALHLLIKHNHKNADEIFCKLISSIPSIRKINDEHFRFLNTIKQKSVSEFEKHFPPLHRELFDTSVQ